MLSANVVIPVGNVTSSRLIHPLNAATPMDVIVVGKTIRESRIQFWAAFAAIAVNVIPAATCVFTKSRVNKACVPVWVFADVMEVIVVTLLLTVYVTVTVGEIAAFAALYPEQVGILYNQKTFKRMILFAQPGFFMNDSNASGILLNEHRNDSLLTIIRDCRHRCDTDFTGTDKCVAIET